MYKQLIQSSTKGIVIPGQFPCQNTSQCPTPGEYNFFSIQFWLSEFYTSISNASIEIYVKFINECATFHQPSGNRKFGSYLKAFYKR